MEMPISVREMDRSCDPDFRKEQIPDGSSPALSRRVPGALTRHLQPTPEIDLSIGSQDGKARLALVVTTG